MTKEEIITKWEKELHRIDLEIFASKQYQTYLSNKITVRKKVILSMLEDLKKLTLPHVINALQPEQEKVPCNNCQGCGCTTCGGSGYWLQ